MNKWYSKLVMCQSDADPILTPFAKERPKERAKNTKLLEEEMGIDLHGFGFGKDFLDMTIDSLSNRERKANHIS